MIRRLAEMATLPAAGLGRDGPWSFRVRGARAGSCRQNPFQDAPLEPEGVTVERHAVPSRRRGAALGGNVSAALTLKGVLMP